MRSDLWSYLYFLRVKQDVFFKEPQSSYSAIPRVLTQMSAPLNEAHSPGVDSTAALDSHAQACASAPRVQPLTSRRAPGQLPAFSSYNSPGLPPTGQGNGLRERPRVCSAPSGRMSSSAPWQDRAALIQPAGSCKAARLPTSIHLARRSRTKRSSSCPSGTASMGGATRESPPPFTTLARESSTSPPLQPDLPALSRDPPKPRRASSLRFESSHRTPPSPGEASPSQATFVPQLCSVRPPRRSHARSREATPAWIQRL